MHLCLENHHFCWIATACTDLDYCFPDRPDYEACTALAQRVLSHSGCKDASKCVLGTVQPIHDKTFIALTGRHDICSVELC